MKRVAFSGNPNSGKSSIINLITSGSLNTGNWSGVTTEAEEVVYEYHNTKYVCIDLPGFYGFSQHDDEQKVTHLFFENDSCDCIVNVIDGTALINALSCTLELRDLQIPMLILLNFEDERKKSGIEIKIETLERRLGIPVVSLSSFDLTKREILMQYIEEQCNKKVQYHPLYPVELDRIFVDYVNACHCELKMAIHDFKLLYPSQCEKARLKAIEGMKSIVSNHNPKLLEYTLCIDRILFKPMIGMVFVFTVFCLCFWILFGLSRPMIRIIDFGFDALVNVLNYSLSFLPHPILSFLTEGLIKSLNVIISFLPIIGCLTMIMGILEDSGLMIRIALLSDYYMRMIRLSGKSMIVFVLALGCNVPAIAASTSLPDKKTREKTALLVPLISCGGRLPVYFFFIDRYFKDKALLLLFVIVGTGFLFICIFSLLLEKKNTKNRPSFVEIPYYRFPNIKKIKKKVIKDCQNYLYTTGKSVLWILLILWFLMNVPASSKESILMLLAKKVSFLFIPLGFGQYWQMTASLLPSLIAKESVVAFLLLCDPNLSFIPACDSASVISFLLFCSTMIPCVMSCMMIKNKYGKKLMLQSLFLMSILPYGISFLFYQFFK